MEKEGSGREGADEARSGRDLPTAGGSQPVEAATWPEGGGAGDGGRRRHGREMRERAHGMRRDAAGNAGVLRNADLGSRFGQCCGRLSNVEVRSHY